MNEKPTAPEKAMVHSNEASWSQVHETVLLLNLAMAQIESSLHESDDSIDTLTDTFTTTVDHIKAITEGIENFPEGQGIAQLKQHCQQVTGLINNAVIAFQFYDKLVQRITHASNSLAKMALLVSDQQLANNPDQWAVLQKNISSFYSTDEEKQMFEAILAGQTVKEALAIAKKSATNNGNDIELF